MSDYDRLVWVDLEMTGLDIKSDFILEMACIITDKDLNIVAKGPDIVVHQPPHIMNSMNTWCKEQHGRSGLTENAINSKTTVKQAEGMMLEFVEKYTKRGRCPLAGNSVHVDKEFLKRDMPSFIEHLHYRIVDVSCIKELCKRWFPNEYKRCPVKKGNHRALDDIEESIAELQFYRKEIFRQ